jgi:photosystem II stability/assembly factor-like uncharacterized protein
LGWAYLWNGSSWASTSVGSHRKVNDVGIFGNDDGWMVGSEKDISTNQYQSLIMRWVDGSWQRVTTPSMNSNWLQAVSILDTNHAWAVGGYATIMWNGSTWNLVPFTWTASPQVLNDVQGVSANDAWAVGEMGTILHWDGSSLAVSSNPATVNLNKVANSSPFDVWVVGMGGIIMHYSPPSASLSINYTNGAPGSFFTLTGANFPANSTATITINGQEVGTVPTDSSGGFVFLLNTDQADKGHYVVTATVNPSASTSFVLDPDDPTRSQESNGTIFNVPAGIAFTHVVYLPLVNR